MVFWLAVKSLEDPRKMLDQAVSEMKEDLVKMRQASAEVMSTQNMLETKYRQAQTSAVSSQATCLIVSCKKPDVSPLCLCLELFVLYCLLTNQIATCQVFWWRSRLMVSQHGIPAWYPSMSCKCSCCNEFGCLIIGYQRQVQNSTNTCYICLHTAGHV